MATLDQLPAEQRAIIELVVQSGRSYDDLADMLGMPTTRVRDLAREALTELAPVTADRVDPDRRGQIADYVLGQQSGAEETATQAHLRRSESGRAWTLSLVDSLADMYDGRRPEIPEAAAEAPPRRRERERDRPRERARERERPRERPREREPRARRPALSPAAASAVRRRRLLGGLAGLVAVAGVVLGIVLLTGGDDDKKKAAPAARAQPRILGELLLQPVNGGSGDDQGIAIVADRGGERSLIVQAKLPPTKEGQAYGVWLYNNQGDAVSVGAQVTDQQGNYQGAGRLPADVTKYKAIDVSLQAIPDEACQRDRACLDRAMRHSGDSVLRGNIADLRAPSQTTNPGQGGQQQPPGGAQTTP